jgi:hypothetical protein
MFLSFVHNIRGIPESFRGYAFGCGGAALGNPRLPPEDRHLARRSRQAASLSSETAWKAILQNQKRRMSMWLPES